MLQRGDLIPHFEVRDLAGNVFRYATIWQRRNLVLVALPASGPDAYARELLARGAVFDERDCSCVITRDAVHRVSAPAVVIADRWGEIAHIAAARDVNELPPAAELLDWLDYVVRRCPECEGEAK
jgi:hypothetical protein